MCEPSEIEQQDCLREVVYERAQMSDQTLAFVPQNKSEAALQEARSLLNKVRDFVAKYPQAAEILRPVASFAERVFDELTIPGGVDNLRKYREGLLTSQEYDMIVSRDAMIDTAAMGVGAFIGRAGGAYGGAIAGGPVVAVAGANLGALEGAVIGGAASKAVRAVARATVHCMAGGGEDGAQRTSGAKDRKVSTHDRVRCTPEDQREFIKEKLNTGTWVADKHKINGRRSYYDPEKDLRYVPVKREKNDIEVWKVSGKKAKHQGAIECKNGQLYEGPKHPDGVFE